MRSKIILICALLILGALAGCVSARYKDVSYTRLGDLETKGVYIAADPNGVMHIEIESTKSEATALDTFFIMLTRAYEAGRLAGGTP